MHSWHPCSDNRSNFLSGLLTDAIVLHRDEQWSATFRSLQRARVTENPGIEFLRVLIGGTFKRRERRAPGVDGGFEDVAKKQTAKPKHLFQRWNRRLRVMVLLKPPAATDEDVDAVAIFITVFNPNRARTRRTHPMAGLPNPASLPYPRRKSKRNSGRAIR